ncbi:SOS response-associated peptidase [Aquibacillus albus]|uniref:Abasic site processing protein n=1 Tax=Aquibacillus albus TaxID=1168171 RepID=A0ABS2N2N4_9BACI|nr:SOS response-associated peptidase [Aquibacillus albus]MBM7572413.1 putative SOS response-associated peptidase YedK [Aquibacillus albus]
MCGRFTMNASELEILQSFDLEGELISFEPRYNIAPGQKVLAIIHDGEKKRAGFLRWGLVPFWAKDPKIGYKMINARSESAHEKPSFKGLMASKRCLIVADSFYEWQKNEQGKQPKRIALTDRKLFAFAGLWDKWDNEGERLFTCTILTKQANDFMRPIHDRMPVILPKEKEDQWIEPMKRKPTEVHEFLTNLSIENLEAYNVSNYVNSAKNEGVQCIEPLIDE